MAEVKRVAALIADIERRTGGKVMPDRWVLQPSIIYDRKDHR